MAAAINQSSNSISQGTTRVNRNISELFETSSQTSQLMENHVRRLAAEIARTTSIFASSYKEMASNPIAASQKNANMAINLAVQAIHGVADLSGSFLSKLGPFGKAIGGATQGILKLGADIAGPLLTTLNDIFGQELNDTAVSFKTMNAMGASFSQGMGEMRVVALKAGLALPTFTAGIQASQESLNKLGLSMGGAIQAVAEVALNFDQVGASGSTLREEMMKMGYAAEEQIGLTADYLALQRSTMTADQFRKMTDAKNAAELAKSTANYAENLKILEGVTGKNAKAELERGRVAAMEGDILAKLGPEAGEKFSMALAPLPEELKKAVLQQISLGAVVDPTAALVLQQNEAARDLVMSFEQMATDTTVSSKDMLKTVLTSLGQAGEEARAAAEDGQNQFQQAARAGAGGAVAGVADTLNELIRINFRPEDIDAAVNAAEDQRKTQDDLTNTVVDMNEQGRKFALEMQDTVLPNLQRYGEMLQTVNSTMMGAVKFGIGMIGGGMSYFDAMTGQIQSGGSMTQEDIDAGVEQGFLTEDQAYELAVDSGLVRHNAMNLATSLPAFGEAVERSGGGPHEYAMAYADFSKEKPTGPQIMPVQFDYDIVAQMIADKIKAANINNDISAQIAQLTESMNTTMPRIAENTENMVIEAGETKKATIRVADAQTQSIRMGH
jgi:hypothetical protein